MTHRPQRIVVAFSLVVLAAVGAGVVVVVFQGSSARSVQELSTALMREVAARTEAATLSYLEAGSRNLEVIRDLVRFGRIDLADDRALEQHFRAFLLAHDEVEMFNLGRPNGDFMMVKRMPDSSLSTKRIWRRGGVAETFWEHDNDAWSREEPYADHREPEAAAYDPRGRPWYRLASESGRLSWIEPYIFFSDRMPGIACALPLFDAQQRLVGVIGADIGIASLSRFLGTFRIGHSGQAVILTIDGRFIAHPGFLQEGFEIVREVVGVEQPELVLRRVDDDPESALASSFSRRPPSAAGGEAKPFTFSHRDVRYVARFESFAVGSDRQWVVGVVAPQTDFMGSVRRGHAMTLTVTLACLILAIGLAAAMVRRADGLEIELLKARTEEKQQLIEDLEARNAEMERFAYTVSHDLKSPLITIGGFLGLLEKDLSAGETDRVWQDVECIRAASGKMARLLDEVLELSRVGRQVNPPQEVSLGDLAREAVGQVAGPIAERGVEIVIATELPAVSGDRPRLLEVLQNLIENAVKFMGEQPSPRIEVGVREDDEEAVFYVRDNGIGVDPRYQERIFELFERLDQGIDGTGVGLALAKRIVEVHGGRIWLESGARRRGSVFCFTLPQGRRPEGRR